MTEVPGTEPRLFSKRWWTSSNPYWGEWRSGPWGYVCLALFIAMAGGGVFFFNNTRQGWITFVVTVGLVLAGTFTARPGGRDDLAWIRRHQAKYQSDEHPQA
ncbi:hypothetical protein SAMN05660748_4492 [Blastococcus aggregatus]|uniref:Uncharacterized protein n=1 Tax=Blastococcus aggregatus TaxID=38502 RepID=A0A285VHI8_9ACTN|nr:hypothetical protein [Blastococcus aggregatus]SOC53549.1 hypothetical protein SAMN05660748_4492 [Blastococcus aggregatus]